MPYTLSHIAAVVPAYGPLSRARVFSAAVIGSMVPDFGLMLGGLARWQTHSLHALFTFCLPVGLAAYALTEWLIRPAVLEVLPDGAYTRLRAAGEPPPLHRPRHWLLVVGALLFGALTHLIWDGFTHENAHGVRLFPELLAYGPEMAGHSLQLYRWAQYGSSVVGLVVVIAALALWLHHAPAPAPRPPRRLAAGERAFWLAAYLALPALLVAWVGWRSWARAHGAPPLGTELGLIGVTSLRAAALSLLLTSVLLRLRLAA